jgi:AcrR family transcriptional regulator
VTDSSSVRRPTLDARTARILDAAASLAARGGLGSVTFVAVAAEAGVSRGSLYRRWKSPVELLGEAVTWVVPRGEPPDTGSVRGDLVALCRVELEALASEPFGPLVARMACTMQDEPALWAALRTSYVEPRRAMLDEVVTLGQQRGELRSGVDADEVALRLAGPALLLRLAGRTLDPGEAERIVDAVLDGLRPRARDR